MRLAFVVQRYGREVVGGAELEARLLAEHLAPYVQVEVLTTCALDYMTWANHYPPGLERVNGVPVRRFEVRTPRDVPAFNRLSERLLAGPRSYYDEARWMEMQGPDAPGLFDFIRERQADYDLFVFFTYLYATTVVGLALVGYKSLLLPTAHDEPWIYFDIFRPVFQLPRGFLFNAVEEDEFIRQRFHNQHIPGVALGLGVEVPAQAASRPTPDEYILYLGRVDESKGCGELFRFFLSYKQATGDPVRLVLIGREVMPVPEHPDIVRLGYLEDEARFAWLQHADLLVLPSPYESFSIATLEAWALGRPALVNGRAAVLRGHCLRGQGGLYYYDQVEFIEALSLLRSDASLRAQLGRQGQAYVSQHYSWPHITQQYLTFLRGIYDQIYP